jgi:hypothetical protein
VTHTTEQKMNSPWPLPYPVDEEGDFVVGRGRYSVNRRANTHPYLDAETHTVWRGGPLCAPPGHAANPDAAVAIIEFDRNGHDRCGTCGHWREVHDDQIPDGWIRDRDKTRWIPGVYVTCDRFTPAGPDADLPDVGQPYQKPSDVQGKQTGISELRDLK